MKKKILIVGLVIVLALALTGCAVEAAGSDNGKIVVELGENVQMQNKLTVQGNGSIKVMPDVAYVTVGVTTNNKEANEAQNENKQIMTAVFDALKKAGLTDDDMRTTNYSTYPMYDYEANEVTSYEVRNMVELTIKDIDNVGKYMDIAAENGANTAYSVRFSILDESGPYNEALKLAMKTAKTKADAIISASGNKILSTLNISENSYGYVSYDRYQMNDEADFGKGATTPITAGELEVTANVTVVYEIE